MVAALRQHCGACHCSGAAEGGVDLDAMLEPRAGDAGWPLAAAHADREAWLTV